ncbi:MULTISPECIES: isopentenyl-diphosphate Delta-isomerase [unclassified Sedimentibacter]|uniref:isopentenyl-diphosphate Delta-isomerase n=1 Tax=unclassified Sedimentibacter TaxID=2649220 RepID=UPI0027E1927E|nr:isopentenyl-diphosphate Delta-isomerase [Sedimentibacter sp. MB35-C1]WMJ78435.1 isopentenyl-diphosphate Delta-isomerase [Sedimentibacter sp. MB35-C1]
MDKIIEVDFNDRSIKEITKEDAHKHGTMHRAFSAILYKGSSILIQRRAYDKYHCGGLWTNTCCSHPRWNEDLYYAVKRRLEEEMGIANAELKEIFSFTYYYKFENGLAEFEYDHVFVGEYNGEFKLNSNEVAEAKWVDIDELMEWMKSKPHEFTPWFVIILPKIKEVLKNNLD